MAEAVQHFSVEWRHIAAAALAGNALDAGQQMPIQQVTQILLDRCGNLIFGIIKPLKGSGDPRIKFLYIGCEFLKAARNLLDLHGLAPSLGTQQAIILPYTLPIDHVLRITWRTILTLEDVATEQVPVIDYVCLQAHKGIPRIASLQLCRLQAAVASDIQQASGEEPVCCAELQELVNETLHTCEFSAWATEIGTTG